jgi:hypothetical protein
VHENVIVHVDANEEIEEVGGIEYRQAGKQASKQASKQGSKQIGTMRRMKRIMEKRMKKGGQRTKGGMIRQDRDCLSSFLSGHRHVHLSTRQTVSSSSVLCRLHR